MENKLPETLKKQISLIEGALYSDSDRRNPEYSKILKKTESREAVYDMLVRKSGNLDEISDEICEKCSNVMKNLTNDLMQCSDTISVSKKDVDWSLYKMAQKASDYYFEIGQMMNNYGLLDVLIDRNDRALTKLNLPFLKVDKKRALKEFEQSNNSRLSYGVIGMKILTQTNKLAKFIEDIKFGTMLNLDRRNAITNNNSRIQLLSNLKTNYLKRVFDEQKVMTDEELQEFQNNGLDKKEYFRLFENDFNLNYEEEFQIFGKFEEKVKKVYVEKAKLAEMLMLLLLNLEYRKNAGQGIKSCGVCKDNTEKLVFGANIQGYIMPATFHISKSEFATMLEKAYILQNAQKGYRQEYKIEEYVPLKGKDGNIVRTNLLYKLDKQQMETLRNEAKKRPDDPVIQFFVKQLSKESTSKTNLINVEELLK